MIPFNPGNLLKFNSATAWQRHRQPGQDRFAFGLSAPASRLIPFQLYFPSGAGVATWRVVNADGSGWIDLDAGLLTVETAASGAFWVTWYGTSDLDTIPPCGFYWVEVTVDGAVKYSETLHLIGTCGAETVSLSLTGECNSEDGTTSFEFAINLNAVPGYIVSLQKFSAGWVTQATNVDTYTANLADSLESSQWRVQLESACGIVITEEYLLTWDEADPCGTANLAFVDEDIVTTGSGALGPTWRMRFTHSANDKEKVLYQSAYQQYFYPTAVAWDRPESKREEDISVDGYGNQTIKSSFTVTKARFEVPDIPDYALLFFEKCGDLDTISFEDAESGTGFLMTEVEFESRAQGIGLNVGVFKFKAETEAFNQCQENFELS